jgi:hypothetical protein
MSKKASLSSALMQATGRAPATQSAVLDRPKKAAPAAANGTASPSREGKKAIAGFFDPAVSRQLKQIGLERGDISVQDMLKEALNDFFTKHGKSAIA